VAPLTVSYKRQLATGSQLVSTSRKLSKGEAQALMAQIAADPAVAQVQIDHMRRAVKDIQTTSTPTPQTFTPNDPYYSQYQWDYSNPTGGANINNAWDLADGTGITVAVIDTGITKHPDIDTSLADAGYDFIADSFVSGRSTDGRVPGGWDTGDWDNTQPYLQACYGSNNPADGDPSSWHGTHVSGTVAELTDNGVGMAGTAYNAKVLPVRVLGHCGGYDSDIADAIEWASGGHVNGVPDNTHVAQVISMSLGGPNDVDSRGNVLPVECKATDVLAVAVAHAIARGTTVVAAAGNDSTDARYFSPGGCAGVITVASNGVAGKRAFYSNYGSAVALSAPGGGVCPNDAQPVASNRCPDGTKYSDYINGWVWSALNTGATVPKDPTYDGYVGTSQATPHVTGTVALILSATKAAGLPRPSPAQIKDILTQSARAFPAKVDQPIGAGIVDAAAAVTLAVGKDNGGGDNGGSKAIALTKGVLLSGQSSSGNSILYSITVPAGAKTLNIRTLAGSGNVALYVKAGSAPAESGNDADFRSTKPGTSEAVVIPVPLATTYYIRVAPQQGSSFSNISVLADYTP
jgi:serine protease